MLAEALDYSRSGGPAASVTSEKIAAEKMPT